jgi:hypothetical protein
MKQLMALLSSIQVWENRTTDLLVWATGFTQNGQPRLFVPDLVVPP